ncbi:MAG: hypothetical protein N2111_01310 [Candidatus Sumerlaeaceae bacterium]|nr:hypothetical protein [Candidatus Sumerlaeaceae bacterium]
MTRRGAALWLGAMAAAYAALVAAHWNPGHLDFGDGNYMYISWRAAQGAMVYRDILAPQPPVHFLIGEVLARAGHLLPHPLYAFRAYSVLLHVATMMVVYAAALRTAGGASPAARCAMRPVGVAAAAIYLLLPLGFWWTLGYQSEPTEMLFMTLAFLLMTRWTLAAAAGAGVLMALAVLTNMTAAPYALFFVAGLALRRPRQLAAYGAPLALLVGGAWVFFEWRTGAFIENVVANQVGSFPRPEFLPPGQTLLDYAVGKIVREGGDVLALEGGYIVLALLGLLRYTRRGPREVREYAALFAAAALMSILYVAKGGTVDYIFTIGEPWVATFSGYMLVHFWRKHMTGGRAQWLPGGADLTALARWLATAMALLTVMGPGLLHSWNTLRQGSYELDEYRTMEVVRIMQRHCPPDGLVLSPPHYAFIAQRRIALDYSELLLWTLKYFNERQDGQRGRGVETVERLAGMLDRREIAFVALDLAQTGRIPEIRAAIERQYRPLRAEEFRTLNTRLQFYVPRQ